MRHFIPRAATAAAIACLLQAVTAPVRAAPACEVASGSQVVPLVELYTSEGCNSCPPADAWLTRLAAREDAAATSLLAFHVDYWDDIGWVDRFGAAAHTRRQRARVTLDKGTTVFTPQVMIGADTRVDWRDEGDARRALRTAKGKSSPVSLVMRVVPADDRVRVGIKAAPVGGTVAGRGMLWLALYQDGLRTEVRAGENQGRTLRHDRVVRTLEGPWDVGMAPVVGEATIRYPEGADPATLGLVLFAESIEDGRGWQSLNLPLAACARPEP
ncbi:DUF1223 domain-containing protein [Marilutibacter aestuarii]|nr:DUF1223 domain-containing protein [Lysobacter aestuarii]